MARVLMGIGVLAMACGLGGCGGADEGTESADATSFGTTLKSAGKSPLTIKVQLLDGKQEKTKNQRFTKATVSRKGKSFGVFCSIEGDVRSSERTTHIECSDDAQTVSDDDNESLSFTIERKQSGDETSYTLLSIDYSGDGTFFGKEVSILTGSDDIDTWGFEPLPLTAKLGKGKTKDPFVFADFVEDTLEAALGKQVASPEVDETLPVRSVGYLLSSEMELDAALRLTKSGSVEVSLPESVSLLKTKGKLSSGYATSNTVLNRIWDVLEDFPTDVTEEDCDVVDDAISDCTNDGGDLSECIPTDADERAVAEACCGEFDLGYCSALD